MTLHCSSQKTRAMTLLEAVVVIFVIAFLVLMLLPVGSNKRAKQIAQRINCANNIKQIGLAFYLWANDHGAFPMGVSTNVGGMTELMGTHEAWRTYRVMSNELSVSKILFCPADDERWPPATNFSDNLKGRISYFIDWDANTNRPLTFLSGDDNLSVAGQPVKSGLFNLSSNSPVAWTTARHHSGGNVGLADGSVHWVKNSELVIRLGQTGLATNRLAIP